MVHNHTTEAQIGRIEQIKLLKYHCNMSPVDIFINKDAFVFA